MVSLIYSEQFVLGFPGLRYLHPFDNYRARRAYAYLADRLGLPAAPVEGFTRQKLVLRVPQGPVADAQLELVHQREYLNSLKTSWRLASAIEVAPFALCPKIFLDWSIVNPKRWAVAGTLLAAREALKCGLAFSLSGGFHHAKRARGEGFCLFNDIAFAIKTLQQENLIQDAVYLDLDAHQGNGVCDIFESDPSLKIFDMYNGEIYPYEDHELRKRVDHNVPLQYGTHGQIYLEILQERLGPFLDRCQGAKLLVYNAGSDVVAGDRLGGLQLSKEHVLQRDLYVIEQARQREMSVVFLPSGGYTDISYLLIADTILACLK